MVACFFCISAYCRSSLHLRATFFCGSVKPYAETFTFTRTGLHKRGLESQGISGTAAHVLAGPNLLGPKQSIIKGSVCILAESSPPSIKAACKEPNHKRPQSNGSGLGARYLFMRPVRSYRDLPKCSRNRARGNFSLSTHKYANCPQSSQSTSKHVRCVWLEIRKLPS